jgi:hypothetical protein
MHISVFIYCSLTNLILLINVQKKENQIISKDSIIPKHPCIKHFFYLIQVLGFKPHPLSPRLPLLRRRRAPTSIGEYLPRTQPLVSLPTTVPIPELRFGARRFLAPLFLG